MDCCNDYMSRIYSKEVDADRFVMVIEMEPIECARALVASANGKIVQVLHLPDPSSSPAGEVVEVVRVALATINIATNKATDLVVVCGLFDAVMANKSLPANLAALPSARGRKVAYAIDARDPEARSALLRRDFIRTLGPIISMSALPGADLKAYIKDLDANSARVMDVFTISDDGDPFAKYDDAASQKIKASSESIRNVIVTFAASSALDMIATTTSRDYYALVAMSHDMRVQAASALPVESALKVTSQVLTRCGLHANVSRASLQECARDNKSPVEYVASMLQRSLKMKKYISP